ncbi:MAG: hypothetical protein WB782_07010 [Thermoplasmata archaeon]
MSESDCVFCNGRYEDLLLHYVMIHEVTDPLDFQKKLDAVRKSSEDAASYRRYIDDLKLLQESGTISGEEFRKRAMLWTRQ